MHYPLYTPPWFLKNGIAMTLYVALWASRDWESTMQVPEPIYQEKIFTGALGVPIFGLVAIPKNARGTIVATYGITGDLDNQWFLRILARKAYAQGWAVVLFDWRSHGKTAQLSPTLTSDGLYEGEDFVRIAASAKAMGCPPQFWFMGYSLGGQLALWGVLKAGEVGDKGTGGQGAGEHLSRGDKGELITQHSALSTQDSKLKTQDLALSQLGLEVDEIGGGAVICPSVDSVRSLTYLVNHPLGKYLEQAIAKQLKKLAWDLHRAHPEAIDPTAIERANSIWGFDQELVIGRLGFASVEDYYNASSALPILPKLKKSTLIIYAEDDPLFDPNIVPDLQGICAKNPHVELLLTPYGGHVGYVSSTEGQKQAGDPDPWWAWNRILDWIAEEKL